MTRTIEIRFTDNPAVNDTFGYSLKFNGIPVVYDTSLQTVSKVFLAFSSAPHGIMRGNTLSASVGNTAAHLSVMNKKTGYITYTSSPTSVFVNITFNGTITVDNIYYTGNIVIDPDDAQLTVYDGINTGELYKAYNNHIVRFGTTGESPAHATLSTDGFTAKLYPDPQGSFFFNFKPYIASLINTRNFDDAITPVLVTANPASFVYDFTQGTYLERDVNFRIARTNGHVDEAQFNLAWFAAAEQPADYRNFGRGDYFVLTPMQPRNATHFYAKYWEGYPFDFAIYCPLASLYLRNTTTGFTQGLPMKGKMNRIVLSDGRTNISLESLLPLAAGYNTIRLMGDDAPSRKDRFLTLQKMPYQCGVYLKWLNKYGGYSYWLFENTYAVDRGTKALGELDNDNANLPQMRSRTTQLGRESQDTMKIVAELLDEDDRRMVEGILESPKIYLFTGQPYARNGLDQWLEVSLKTSSARIRNARERLTNFTFDLELPQRYTQTL